MTPAKNQYRYWGQCIPTSARRVICEVAVRHEVNPRNIIGSTQEREAVNARDEACRQLRARGYSLVKIGKILGGRHHTTILAALRREPRGPIEPITKPYDPFEPDLSGEWAI